MDDGFKITWRSDKYDGRGGQHTNGPDYGVVRVEHEPTRTAVEIETRPGLHAHAARSLAMTLCQMAVSETAR